MLLSVYFCVALKSLEAIQLYVNKFCKEISYIVEGYMDRHATLVYQQAKLEPSSVRHAMLEIQIYKLIQECRERVRLARRQCHTRPNGNGHMTCPMCNIQMIYREQTSEAICTRCGNCVSVLQDMTTSYGDMKQYNCNMVHRYCSYEHFAQCLCDFTGIGNRKIAKHIITYCKASLGTGDHVTSEKVFDVLSSIKETTYYPSKYTIANILRHTPEFVVTQDEVRRARDEYKRYDRWFTTYQHENKIGFRSKKGKLRILWPMRFIMARVFENIDRPDLVQYLRKVSDRKRLALYWEHWNRLSKTIEQKAHGHEFGPVILYPN